MKAVVLFEPEYAWATEHACFIKICCQLILVYVFVLFQENSPLLLIIPHPHLNKKDRKSYFVALDSIIKSANVKVFRKFLNFFVEIVLYAYQKSKYKYINPCRYFFNKCNLVFLFCLLVQTLSKVIVKTQWSLPPLCGLTICLLKYHDQDFFVSLRVAYNFHDIVFKDLCCLVWVNKLSSLLQLNNLKAKSWNYVVVRFKVCMQ